jgi:hypothetical protein
MIVVWDCTLTESNILETKAVIHGRLTHGISQLAFSPD